jgi:hypothetical protein
MTRDVSALFASVGLSLVVEHEPIDPGRGLRRVDIVQLDIARRSRREWFRLFPGHRANRIRVDAVDAAQRQAVLTVQETVRAFEARIDASTKPDPHARVLRREGDTLFVEQYTRSAPQHYLCGQDESHLFIAQLPTSASSIARAHALLAPRVPEDYANQSNTRQGEWFFFATTQVDKDELERLDVLGYGIKKDVGIAEAARLRRAGRPHVVTELRLLKGSLDRPGKRIFVRGHVRHPDHRTLHFPDWHRVLPNREISDRRPRGVLWVD